MSSGCQPEDGYEFLGIQICWIHPDTTAALWLHYGEIPSVELAVQQVTQWISFIRTGQFDSNRLSIAWHKIVAALAKVPTRNLSAKVSDPIAAIVATLRRARWTPSAPHIWHDEVGHPTSVVSAMDAGITIRKFKESAHAMEWDNSEQHSFAGEGMGKQPCFGDYKRAKAKLVKMERYAEARALTIIAAGGANLGCRFERNNQCRRCGFSPETPAHRYYSCPHLQKAFKDDPVASEWIQKTQWLVSKAKRDGYSPECLYARGILPHNYSYGLTCDHEEITTHIQGSYGPTSSVAYTDGSGGDLRQDVPSWCKRAGAATVSFQLGTNWSLESLSFIATSI